MLRPPSAQKPYDTYYSQDPGILQLDKGATPAMVKEHQRLLTIARETGDWGRLLMQDCQPTKFVMRPLGGEVVRRLNDRLIAGAGRGGLGPNQAHQIAFRAAIVSIENWGEYDIERDNSAEYGSLAKTTLTDALDLIDSNIVDELGLGAMRRAQGVSPLY